MGFAPRSGLPRGLGQRPYQGHSPDPCNWSPARHSLASHPAAEPAEYLAQDSIELAGGDVPEDHRGIATAAREGQVVGRKGQ